jgi:hypothetical protein
MSSLKGLKTVAYRPLTREDVRRFIPHATDDQLRKLGKMLKIRGADKMKRKELEQALMRTRDDAYSEDFLKIVLPAGLALTAAEVAMLRKGRVSASLMPKMGLTFGREGLSYVFAMPLAFSLAHLPVLASRLNFNRVTGRKYVAQSSHRTSDASWDNVTKPTQPQNSTKSQNSRK